MKYRCEKCGAEYDLGPEHIGVPLGCACGHKFTVPPPAAAPAPAAGSPSPGEKMPMQPVEVMIVTFFSALCYIAGLILIVLNFILVQQISTVFNLALAGIGAVFLVIGSLIGCIGLAVRKLYRIEWYLSRMYKKQWHCEK